MHKTVAVVDDSPLFRAMCRRALTAAGYDVWEAENGVEFLEKWHVSPAHLVIMDVVMPEMDGLEATEIVRKEACRGALPVVFVTAVDDEDIVYRCADAGGNDMLNKPVSPSQIIAMVQRHVVENPFRSVQDEFLAARVGRRVAL